MPLFREWAATRALALVSAAVLSATPVMAQTADGVIEQRLERLENRVGITPGGGGAYLRDNGIELRMLGYVQGQANVFDGALDRNSSHDFSLRRARLDFLVDLYDDYQLFVELDGAPDRTALVEARLDMALGGEALKLRAGKFTSQFSTENARSSRSIDTVERYLALNSLFLLPALDTQYGLMAHGRAGGDQRFNWSLGVNWFVNPNVRLQVNGIATHVDGPSASQGFSESRSLPSLLTQLQFKF